MAQAQDGPSPAADGHWLTVSRLTVYPRIFLTVFILSASSWMLLSQDMLDPQGKPIGYDFLTFWSASKLSLSGDPAAAFDMEKLFEVEQATVPGIDKPFLWHYPPTFQLVTLPLALVSILKTVDKGLISHRPVASATGIPICTARAAAFSNALRSIVCWSRLRESARTWLTNRPMPRRRSTSPSSTRKP